MRMLLSITVRADSNHVFFGLFWRPVSSRNVVDRLC